MADGDRKRREGEGEGEGEGEKQREGSKAEKEAGREAHPEASRSLTGFQAQMKTSDSCPRSTVALLAGISTSRSRSMGSPWWSEWGSTSHTLLPSP